MCIPWNNPRGTIWAICHTSWLLFEVAILMERWKNLAQFHGGYIAWYLRPNHHNWPAHFANRVDIYHLKLNVVYWTTRGTRNHLDIETDWTRSPTNNQTGAWFITKDTVMAGEERTRFLVHKEANWIMMVATLWHGTRRTACFRLSVDDTYVPNEAWCEQSPSMRLPANENVYWSYADCQPYGFVDKTQNPKSI